MTHVGKIIVRLITGDIEDALARDSRTPYKSIAAEVGITPSAAKQRIDKMISSGVIERFAVLINPLIFGYEKLLVLLIKNIGKTTKEQEIFKKLSLLGDLVAYSEELEGSYIFRLYVKDITQYKLETITELQKPATVEFFFADFSQPFLSSSAAGTQKTG